MRPLPLWSLQRTKTPRKQHPSPAARSVSTCRLPAGAPQTAASRPGGGEEHTGGRALRRAHGHLVPGRRAPAGCRLPRPAAPVRRRGRLCVPPCGWLPVLSGAGRGAAVHAAAVVEATAQRHHQKLEQLSTRGAQPVARPRAIAGSRGIGEQPAAPASTLFTGGPAFTQQPQRGRTQGRQKRGKYREQNAPRSCRGQAGGGGANGGQQAGLRSALAPINQFTRVRMKVRGMNGSTGEGAAQPIAREASTGRRLLRAPAVAVASRRDGLHCGWRRGGGGCRAPHVLLLLLGSDLQGAWGMCEAECLLVRGSTHGLRSALAARSPGVPKHPASRRCC